MGVILAPYTSGMKLGSGFNSYTQQLCVDGAVSSEPQSQLLKKTSTNTNQLQGGTGSELEDKEVAQSVTFSRSRVRKTSDITKTLNISGAMTVKYNNLFDGNGQADFIDSNTVNTSDITYMFNVKVVNQVTEDHTLTKFNPMSKVTADQFADVYGDCFISGFQEGGEFTAIISVKVSNRSQKEDISAKAAIAFSTPKFEKGDGKEGNKEKADSADSGEASNKKGAADKDGAAGGLSVKGDGEAKRVREEIFAENEVKYSVTWTGGGQHLKKLGEDWNFETILSAATHFPELVAKTPMRTHAILTKYTTLKSFHSIELIYSPLSYDNVTIYTNILMDAYLEYKFLLREIQELTNDVQAQKKKLEAAPVGLHDSEKGTHKAFVQSLQMIGYNIPWYDNNKDADGNDFKLESKPYVFKPALAAGDPKSQTDSSESGSTAVVTQASTDLQPVNINKRSQPPPEEIPLVIAAPYPATLAGLVAARIHCRYLMNRIVKEVDRVTKWPEFATNEDRLPPYMSPTLFKELLPKGASSTDSATA